MTAQSPAPATPSPRLYSADLAPMPAKARHWGAYSIFTMWANDSHSLGNYTFAIGLFALGLGVWQIMVTFLIGSSILFGLLTLSGMIGLRTGLPFPVVSRIAFGIRGGKVAAVLRGGVAIVWFGIQTYLAAIVFSAMLVGLVPEWAALEETSFLGLSTLNWYSFIFLWFIQLLIASFGMSMVKYFVSVAGPVILVTMAAMAVWVWSRADFSIAMSIDNPLTGGAMWGMIFSGAILWVVIYGTFALNFCDFTRNVTSAKAIVTGNFGGILLNMMLFALIVVLMSGGSYKVDGSIVTSPADIVRHMDNLFWRTLASLVLVILTVGVNLVANFVAPNYMLTDLMPRVLNFRRASIVTAVVGAIILPWKLYDSPTVINLFLGSLGAILGPLFGLIMVDYWLVRRQRINIPDLYREDPAGSYYYDKGVNRRAFYALVPSAIVGIVLSQMPGEISNFSWIVGAVVAAILYWLISPKGLEYLDVSGEPIANAGSGGGGH